MDAVMTEARLTPDAVRPERTPSRQAEPIDLGVVFEVHAAPISGIRSTDEMVPPANGDGVEGYKGVWRVVREGKAVASIDHPELEGIACRWNAIGTG